MDMQFNLFFLEDCFKCNSGYSYLHSSLNALLEHKTFSLRNKNESQSVITFINTKLNSHGDRAQGLHLLRVFLPQCSDDVFHDNCVSWMQQCVRICGASREKEIVSLAYEILGNLFQYSGMLQELTKSISGSVIPKFLEHILQISADLHPQAENPGYLLRCVEFVIRNYGGSCSPHKNNLEQFLMKFVDHPDKQTVTLVARCVAVLPLTGGGGALNVNHKNSWEVLQKKLVLQLQETLDAIFEGVPEIQLFQTSDRNGIDNLHVPVLEECDPFLRIQQLTMRFINLSCFLKELLLHELPVAKRVMPLLFINLLIRGFRVNSNTVSKQITADKLIVGCLIPQMHIALLQLLKALIICCGQNLLEYGSLICRLVLQTLKWTSYDKHWPHGTEKPYGQLRKEAYNTLTLWLQVAKAGSCVEISSPDELIDLLLGDVKISHTSVTLSAARARGRHLTKQQRKQLKLGQDGPGTSPEPCWSRIKLYDETANHETCAAALQTLQWVLQSAGPFLNPMLHKMIQEAVLKIMFKLGRDEVFAPYGDWKCRLELHRLLHALVLWPHNSWPPPLHFAFKITRAGLSDPSVKVASFCSQSLNNFVKLAHPVNNPLHFPPSVVDMQEVIQLEHSHKKKIVLSESMDTDICQINAQHDSRLHKPSTSPEHICNNSENYICERDENTVKNNTAGSTLDTKAVCDGSPSSLDHIDAVYLNHIGSSQDESLRCDGISNHAMDFVRESNESFQQLSTTVTSKSQDQNNKLEKQNGHNTNLLLKLIDTEHELRDNSAETEEDSCISGSHHVVSSESPDEKFETVDRASLLEKLEAVGGGGQGGGGVDDDNDDGGSDDDDDEQSEEIRNESEDKTDDVEMQNVGNGFLVIAKGPYIKEDINLKHSDKTAEKSVVSKAPTSPNNYSISYLYDQSSDSNNSDAETEIVTCPVLFVSNEADKETLPDGNSLKNLPTLKTVAHEDSQTCKKFEDISKMECINAPQKLISDMCAEKIDGEEHSDSAASNSVADVSKHIIVAVDLSGSTDSENSEVDVTTIPEIPVKTEEAEDTDTTKVMNSLLEGTVKHENMVREIPKDHDVKVTESLFKETIKETTVFPEERNDPTEICCVDDGNSLSEIKDNQCAHIQGEEGLLGCSSQTKTVSLEKSKTIECHDRDKQFDTQGQIKLSVQIPGKELMLQDENQDASNEQIIRQQTSFSPIEQVSTFEVDSHSVKREVEGVYIDSAVANTYLETEKVDSENLTEPLTKKLKLEPCVTEKETENNCSQQQKLDDV